MPLPTSYMTGNYSKIPKYFEVMLNAQAPEKFTVKFLKDLGFTSSADTQFINVLKSLGFLDDSGTPTETYYQLFDRSIAQKLVAEGIRTSYADLFALNVNAQDMERAELKGKFKTLTSGQKSESAINQMVSTFIELCKYADWSDASPEASQEPAASSAFENQSAKQTETTLAHLPKQRTTLSYDIHIHLPATRDERVYDALFSSLTKYTSI